MTRCLLALAAFCWVAPTQADPPIQLSVELVEWRAGGGPAPALPPPNARSARSLTVGAFRGREFAAATRSETDGLEVEGAVIRSDPVACRLRVTVRTFRRFPATGEKQSHMTGHEELEVKWGEPLMLSYFGGAEQNRAILVKVSK